MKSLLLAAALAALFSTPAFAQDWALDAEASSVEARLLVFNARPSPASTGLKRYHAGSQRSGQRVDQAVVYAASGVVTNAEGRADQRLSKRHGRQLGP
jgi:opacity protein-like surface antigen